MQMYPMSEYSVNAIIKVVRTSSERSHPLATVCRAQCYWRVLRYYRHNAGGEKTDGVQAIGRNIFYGSTKEQEETRRWVSRTFLSCFLFIFVRRQWPVKPWWRETKTRTAMYFSTYLSWFFMFTDKLQLKSLIVWVIQIVDDIVWTCSH